VSEDYIYDTVEFNEFLQMMAKQQDLTHSADAVAEAFRFKSIQGYGQMMRLP